MKLVWPSREYLPGYVAALERGWSSDNVRGLAAAQEERAIAADANAFLASLIDREAAGDPVTLPDGTQVPRLPGFRRWLWDGEFCGSIANGGVLIEELITPPALAANVSSGTECTLTASPNQPRQAPLSHSPMPRGWLTRGSFCDCHKSSRARRPRL